MKTYKELKESIDRANINKNIEGFTNLLSKKSKTLHDSNQKKLLSNVLNNLIKVNQKKFMNLYYYESKKISYDALLQEISNSFPENSIYRDSFEKYLKSINLNPDDFSFEGR